MCNSNERIIYFWLELIKSQIIDYCFCYLWTDGGEDKLEQVEHTGAGVGPAQVLEHEVRAEAAGLQLSPGNNTECHKTQNTKHFCFVLDCVWSVRQLFCWGQEYI